MILEFTDLALDDLASIERYTRQHWGEKQADMYLDLLEQALAGILDNPEIGPERSDVADDCRYLPEQSHLIFYRIAGNKIQVLAIPHNSMDVEKYLALKE